MPDECPTMFRPVFMELGSAGLTMTPLKIGRRMQINLAMVHEQK